MDDVRGVEATANGTFQGGRNACINPIAGQYQIGVRSPRLDRGVSQWKRLGGAVLANDPRILEFGLSGQRFYGLKFLEGQANEIFVRYP